MQMLDRHIWQSMISLNTKLRLYNVYILPVYLYGAETWSITKAIEKRIDAFDQWCLRRILNITWSECVTNFEVRRRTGQPLLSDTVWTRRLKLFGQRPRVRGGQVSRSFPCSTSLLIARSKELEAASRSSKTYLAKDGGRWRKICANLILVSRQGFGEHKTEQLGGGSQEQQRH